MALPLGDKGRTSGGRRRRSYADYNDPNRGGPPFLRILFYLTFIGLGLWAARHPDDVRDFAATQVATLRPTVDPALVTPSPYPTGSLEFYAAEAQAAYELGQLTDAITAYEEAAARDPSNPRYPYEIARLLIFRSAVEYGDQREASLEAALEASQRAISANPESPLGYAIQARAFDWLGQPEQGRPQAVEAINRDPNSAVAHSILAEVEVDLQDYAAADQAIATALELGPTEVDVIRDHAYVLERFNQNERAAQRYEDALQLQPRLAHLHLGAARNYRLLTVCDPALDNLFEAQKVEPASGLIFYEIGLTFEVCVGNTDEALSAYQSATQNAPELAAAWLRLGAVRYAKTLHEGAIEAFEQAADLRPLPLSARWQLGAAYTYEGNCAEGLPLLAQAQSELGDDQVFAREIVTERIAFCEGAPTPAGPP